MRGERVGIMYRVLLVPLVGLLVGCGLVVPDSASADCLDEAGVEELRARYLADPSVIESEYAGSELCVDGIVSHIQRQFGSISVGVNLSDQVGDLITYDEAREPEKYRALAAWAEQHKEGDPIRVVCTLREFVMVDGAPEPMVIPALSNCSPAE